MKIRQTINITLALVTLMGAFLTGCADDRANVEPQETISALEAVSKEPESLAEATEMPTSDVEPSKMPELTMSPEPTPAPTPFYLSKGDEGEDVLFVQQRLIELNYLDKGMDTGKYLSKTVDAVKRFQKKNGLDETGIVDEATYNALISEDAKPLPTETPKPKTLSDYEKKILDNFEQYAPTVNMSFEELVGDDGIYDLPKGYPSPDTYYIIVDIKHQVTMVYTKDKNGEYTVPVRFMLCSTGANDCTPKGTFKMDSFRVRFTKFVRDGRYGQYLTQIRKAIYFHSILYTEKDAATYQPDIYELLGTADSHGCVRLTVPDARWMWYHIAKGTKCLIRDGSSSDLMTAEIRKRLVLCSAPKKRVDLKPGEIPNTDNWSIDEIPLEVPFVQGSQD